MLYETYDPNLYQGQGPLTYAGRKRSSTEHHHRGKQVLDIHLLKAERLAALPLGVPASLSGPPSMMDADDAATPEWVTYAFRTAHPILRWLPSKLAVWLAENMRDELAKPEKQGAKYPVPQLNSILASNLVPTGNWDGGHLRTFTTLQWESDDYRGLPKARCYPFDLNGHRFRGQNPQVCTMYYISCYIRCYIAHVI
jgi:hypothetical protein